jgi:hypothetical protein
MRGGNWRVTAEATVPVNPGINVIGQKGWRRIVADGAQMSLADRRISCHKPLQPCAGAIERHHFCSASY